MISPLKVIGDCGPDKHGTKVSFFPDATIFQETQHFDFAVLKQRLREMAFLTKNLRIDLHDLREGMQKDETFHYEGGIKEFVSYLNKSTSALYEDIIYCEGKKGDIYVEVAI